jgi:hypothetical protein
MPVIYLCKNRFSFILLDAPLLPHLCRSSLPPLQLTEEETEYKVVCVRHILEGHLVFQFNCTNTVREQVLEHVSVAMDLDDLVSCAWGEGEQGGRLAGLVGRAHD